MGTALFDAGWSVPAWPAVRRSDCDLIEWLIYEEEWLSGVPAGQRQRVSLLAPTIFSFGARSNGTTSCREWRVANIWAQGWSEPEAGSDLAGIKTKAILDGDDLS